MSLEERRCRVCGCTDDDACEDGCSWVEDDLCSSCEYKEMKTRGGPVYTIPFPLNGEVFDLSISKAQLRTVLRGSGRADGTTILHLHVSHRGKVKS